MGDNKIERNTSSDRLSRLYGEHAEPECRDSRNEEQETRYCIVKMITPGDYVNRFTEYAGVKMKKYKVGQEVQRRVKT